MEKDKWVQRQDNKSAWKEVEKHCLANGIEPRLDNILQMQKVGIKLPDNVTALLIEQAKEQIR